MKNFEKILKSIDFARRDFDVYADFLEISTLVLSSRFQPSEEKEKRYKQIWNKYKQAEKFIELFCLLTKILEENPFQDFLGEFYMKCGNYNKNTGQFFTPFHLSIAMAKLNIDFSQIDKKGYITVSEPTCGSGANIIAAAKVLKEENYNPQTSMFFVAQDLDFNCCNMCYLQTALTGLSGQVIWGNTLTLESKELYNTPMAYSNVWEYWHTVEKVKKDFNTFLDCCQTTNKKTPKQMKLQFDIE